MDVHNQRSKKQGNCKAACNVKAAEQASNLRQYLELCMQESKQGKGKKARK